MFFNKVFILSLSLLSLGTAQAMDDAAREINYQTMEFLMNLSRLKKSNVSDDKARIAQNVVTAGGELLKLKVQQIDGSVSGNHMAYPLLFRARGSMLQVAPEVARAKELVDMLK